MDRDFLGWQGRYFLHNVSPDPLSRPAAQCVLTGCVPGRSRIVMSSTTSSPSCRTVRISISPNFPSYIIVSAAHFFRSIDDVVCTDNLPAATEYAKKLLGSDYRACETPVFKSLWLNQLHCQYVDREGEDVWIALGGV